MSSDLGAKNIVINRSIFLVIQELQRSYPYEDASTRDYFFLHVVSLNINNYENQSPLRNVENSEFKLYEPESKKKISDYCGMQRLNAVLITRFFPLCGIAALKVYDSRWNSFQ